MLDYSMNRTPIERLQANQSMLDFEAKIQTSGRGSSRETRP